MRLTPAQIDTIQSTVHAVLGSTSGLAFAVLVGSRVEGTARLDSDWDIAIQWSTRMLPMDKLNFFMENRVIEIAPLAYMRGRTLDHAFIILDEAQNATPLQLKMFLTRLGPSAKCIITGDLSQIDLPGHQKSGLRQSMDILDGVEGIVIMTLSTEDVVRHRLVKDIINAYDKIEAEERARKERKRLSISEASAPPVQEEEQPKEDEAPEQLPL
jgi:phosphate starvation-inducible PhoH-like protein